jgi:hypothetical protein
MNPKLNNEHIPALRFDHSECLDKLWNFYKDGDFSAYERDEIEKGIQLLAPRIYSSMMRQTRIVRIDNATQEPIKLHFTQLKGRAEVLQSDAIGFLRYFSELTDHLNRTALFHSIDFLTVSKICMEKFEQSSLVPYGGEIVIELAAHTEYELLFDSCAATSMVIAYAMECTPDAGHLSGSLDVLEFYDRDVFGHPLSGQM